MKIAFSIIALTAWVITLKDITKSEFIDNSSSKWFWLVLCTGSIGMMFYYYYGIKKKAKKKYKFIK